MSATPEAVAYGRKMAPRLFAGRKGHGGGKVTSRVLREAEIIALLAIAYDAGVAASRARG